VHTNQKRFQYERAREKRTVLRERKETLSSPVNKVDRVISCQPARIGLFGSSPLLIRKCSISIRFRVSRSQALRSFSPNGCT